MNHIIELDKTEHEIRDLESRYTSIKDGINSIEREICLLNVKELALSENIKNQKKTSIVVLATEFRRTKEDLNKARTRKSMIEKDKVNLEKALKEISTFLTKARVKLDELRKNENTNVLQGSFGSKNGQ